MKYIRNIYEIYIMIRIIDIFFMIFRCSKYFRFMLYIEILISNIYETSRTKQRTSESKTMKMTY